MNTRQNPLNRVESFMKNLIEGPFAIFFPTKLQPAQVARKLEHAMEDASLIQGDGRRIAPEIYDIYLSIKDHQQMQPIEAALKEGWESQLIQFARLHNYYLRINPVFRLHARANLRVGDVHIDTLMVERGSSADSGIAHTQQLSKEEVERLKASLQPGITGAPGMSNSATVLPQQGQYSYPAMTYASGIQPTTNSYAPAMPQAWLTIKLPQSEVRKEYRIDKAVVGIGRQLDNDIIVEDKRVSRYHAQIKFLPDGQFIIYDLDSINGINVNGVPNQRQHVLQNGDRFTIGSYDFYFQRR